jgi:hypothetical protein
MTRLRVLERVGRAIGFSPEGRSIRVWVRGMPGADETEVLEGPSRRFARATRCCSCARRVGPSGGCGSCRTSRAGGSVLGGSASFSVDVFELEADKVVRRWFLRLGEVGSTPDASCRRWPCSCLCISPDRG